MLPEKKELCKKFQRGRCRFGNQCRFLHEQRSNPNSVGIGSQSPNPNQTQFKPIETQRNPFPSTDATTSNPSCIDEIQPEVPDHECMNPESCKQIIVEDLEHEMPLWKLTCYGHRRYGPCDIIGEISYEELRAAAYDNAMKGMPIMTIIEGERNQLKSKLLEFQSLKHNVTTGPSSFPATNLKCSAPPNFQNNTSLTVSSFSQLGASLGRVTRHVQFPWIDSYLNLMRKI